MKNQKVVVITAGGGIGEAITRELHGRGCHVAVMFRSSEPGGRTVSTGGCILF